MQMPFNWLLRNRSICIRLAIAGAIVFVSFLAMVPRFPVQPVHQFQLDHAATGFKLIGFRADGRYLASYRRTDPPELVLNEMPTGREAVRLAFPSIGVPNSHVDCFLSNDGSVALLRYMTGVGTSNRISKVSWQSWDVFAKKRMAELEFFKDQEPIKGFELFEYFDPNWVQSHLDLATLKPKELGNPSMIPNIPFETDNYNVRSKTKYSPSGRWLTARPTPDDLEIIDTLSNRKLQLPRADLGVPIRYGRDERKIYIIGNPSVKCFQVDLESGSIEREYNLQDKTGATHFDISPDEKYLAMTTQTAPSSLAFLKYGAMFRWFGILTPRPVPSREVHLFDIESGKPVGEVAGELQSTFATKQSVPGLASFPGDLFLITQLDGCFSVWSLPLTKPWFKIVIATAVLSLILMAFCGVLSRVLRRPLRWLATKLSSLRKPIRPCDEQPL